MTNIEMNKYRESNPDWTLALLAQILDILDINSCVVVGKNNNTWHIEDSRG